MAKDAAETSAAPIDEGDSSNTTLPISTANEGVLPSIWRKICESVAKLANLGDKLAVSLPNMTESLHKVETVQNEIIEEINRLDFPPTKQTEIRKLKSEFNDCILTAKQFLHLCVDMATFCLDKDLVETLDRELPRKVTTLCNFIDRFCSYFKQCQEKLNEFQQQHDNVQSGADESMQQYYKKEEDNKAQLEAAKMNHAAHLRDNSSSLAHKMSQLALSSVATANLPTDAAGTLTGLLTSVNIFAHLYEWKRGNNLFRDKQTMQDKARGADIAKRAQKAISDLQLSLYDIRDLVKQIWSEAEIASIQADAMKSYKFEEVGLNPVDSADIRTKLSSLRESMRKILVTLGEKGERIDWSVTRVQAYQSTSDSEIHGINETTLSIPVASEHSYTRHLIEDQIEEIPHSVEEQNEDEAEIQFVMPPPPQQPTTRRQDDRDSANPI